MTLTTKIETKIVYRKCIVSNQIYPVNQLLRFDLDKKNNIITLDLAKVKKGRGAYFYPNEENWKKIVKTKGLNRAFRTAVNKDVYDEIEKQLKEAKCLKIIE